MKFRAAPGARIIDRRKLLATPLLLLGIFLSLGEGATAQKLQLSLQQAIDLALSEKGNTEVLLAREHTNSVRAQLRQRRAALLPHLEASVSQLDQTRNLEALGLQSAGLFRPPSFVGPFTTFDMRASLSQNLLDVGSIRRYQASRAAVTASELETETAEERTAAGVARTYLKGLRNQARLDAARANSELAAALLAQARDQKAAGAGTGIEVTRALVEQSNQAQLLLAAELEHRRSLLELSRMVGLNLDTELELTDDLSYQPVNPVEAGKTIELALGSRPDLAARTAHEQRAQLDYSAARLDRLPALSGFFDYGTIGSGPHNTIPTWTLGLALRLPLFDGGRMEGEKAERLSRLRQEQVRKFELHRQIEVEIRLALDGLRLAEEQIRVAEEGLQLAQQELEAARRRNRAGVTTSLEVTHAQARLERARENRISALFSHNLKRIELAEGMGTVRQMTR